VEAVGAATFGEGGRVCGCTAKVLKAIAKPTKYPQLTRVFFMPLISVRSPALYCNRFEERND